MYICFLHIEVINHATCVYIMCVFYVIYQISYIISYVLHLSSCILYLTFAFSKTRMLDVILTSYVILISYAILLLDVILISYVILIYYAILLLEYYI